LLEQVVIRAGKEVRITLPGGEFEVYAGESEWWDETYAACVLPLGGECVTALAYLPGKRARSTMEARYVSFASTTHKAPLDDAAIDHFVPRAPFVVEVDVMPSAACTTERLVALFVAYAFAGSMCGTRLLPLVASRAVGSEARRIRSVLDSAPCPFGFYAVCAADYRAYRAYQEELAQMLRCEVADAGGEVRARMRSVAYDDPPALSESVAETHARVQRRVQVSPVARYGACERDFLRARLKGSSPRAYGELLPGYEHTDAWRTALEASTGRFVRADQRAKVGEIVATARIVVQMHMGFGKSSVIVPMLVARYLASARVVFVTQPAHLVPQAMRTIGAFIAAQPTDEPIYAMDVDALRAFPESVLSPLRERLVVVLSTADMQSFVRDHPRVYARSADLAHIADEVDAESDPLRCEVVIEGPETRAHHDADVAADIDVYYAAAFEIGTQAGQRMEALRSVSATSASRLERVHAGLADLVHKVAFGPSADAGTHVAVPYNFANVPSRFATFADLDVAMVLYVKSVLAGIRATDGELVTRDITAKFGPVAAEILANLTGDERARYYATQIGMPRIRMCTTEIAVSFTDVLGCAPRFVGFSGTMGTALQVPQYVVGDPRHGGKDVPVHSDTGRAVADIMANATPTVILGAPSEKRSRAILDAIVARCAGLAGSRICVVDCSGEFGAFADHTAAVRAAFGAAEIGHFDDAGALVHRECAWHLHRGSDPCDRAERPDRGPGFDRRCRGRRGPGETADQRGAGSDLRCRGRRAPGETACQRGAAHERRGRERGFGAGR
jgi:hypothetical protein